MGIASQQRAMWGVPVPRPISREEKKLWTKKEKAMYKAFELQGKDRALVMMRAYFANKKVVADEHHELKAKLSFQILLPKKFCEESAQLTTLLKKHISAFCGTEAEHVEASGVDFKSDLQVCVEFAVELEHPGDKVHEKLKEHGVLAAHFEENGIPEAEMQEDSVQFSPGEGVVEGKEKERTEDQTDENTPGSGEEGEGRKRKADELSV
mmetsp:Transcript_11344/g.27251  ORF Transcript_11344/g.27251 Transcript_11344/m.27251 type:complete len:209 (+) Transcript_11344:271-897(+)|eukprot:CAMPEP_0177720448 /NCGR_PEP_ID=MMETSP0484_2-20121128/16628_1 /TAXON_ID=354590 /ORGANISM="Rhodomonas lens, Strain RHODO" /LENGTH=208 /DNA_ID=CAMNT_0019232705 /DNA_START=250 /DNA_END=876 /DNA_ORIENTATION=-